MAASNFLFGSNTLPDVNTSQTTTSNTPIWFQQAQRALINRGSEIAAEDYQPYGAPRIAGIDNDQTAAYNRIRGGVGAYNPQLSQASTYLTDAGGAFNEQEFDSYMNPYTSRVVDQIGDIAGRNLREKLLPAVNDTFTGAGQFGSGRHAEFTGRALRDTQEAALAEQDKALNTGYGASMNAYQESQGRRLNAGTGLQNLATAGQNVNLRDAAALEGVGAAERGNSQAGLDLAYSDFINQTNYPRQNVNFLAQLMGNSGPLPTTQTQTSTGPATASQQSPSALGQVAGAGLGALGIYGLLNGRFKKGGAVKRRPAKRVPPMGKKRNPRAYATGGAVGIGGYR